MHVIFGNDQCALIGACELIRTNMVCLIISKVGTKIAMPVADDKTVNLGESLLLWLTPGLGSITLKSN